MSKKSFFEKLTGSIKFNNEESIKDMHDDDYLDDDVEELVDEEEYDEDEIGELSVDMYQIDGAIVIKAMIPGIQKSDIDITLTRDMITIQGSRQNKSEGKIHDMYYQELYWGGFERTIELPEEIDIEASEAHEAHGLLTLILPLIDKHKQANLKIK